MESAVKKALGTKVFKATGISGGGCISSGSSYITDNGSVFVKVNHQPNAKAMFQGEMAGLMEILSTGTIKCPRPLAIVKDGSSSALVMDNLHLTSLNTKGQVLLGQQLAGMHLHNKALLDKANVEEFEDGRINQLDSINCDGDRSFEKVRAYPTKKFGFHIPTSCGYLSQDNSWQDDWTTTKTLTFLQTFYIRQKLQPQVDLILEKGDRELKDIWPICKRKIEETLSDLGDITPALVHGDLWSGNVASSDNVPVIFDPASFYGHSEYDFGIANMFGGFSRAFYDSYHEIIPKAEGFSKREKIYELFHHLNHWNHFGSGYRGQTIGLMNKITNL